MLIFESVLILLSAVFVSHLINKFIPFVSVSLIQASLGAAVVLLPVGFHLELDPELFFVLFIAPFVFRSGVLLDKKIFLSVKWPILNLSVLLVFATVISVGYFLNFLLPAIPLAASFVLIASLGPTDDVAVASVSNIVKVPDKIMNILRGESMLNDVSGIISFQFALAAVLTSSFSLTSAAGRFLFVGLGGAAAGILFTAAKYVLAKWMRSLGIENNVLHIFMELLTPFIIYLGADYVGVSPILAVFTAGIIHSFARDAINPDNINLNIASDNVWNTVSFSLEGLVFLFLGAQIPKIIQTMADNSYSVGNLKIIEVVLLITAAFILSRFLWSFFTISSKNYSDGANRVSKVKASLIISLSGARGAVTLASVMSIPFLLNNGLPFPQRDLIILISTGIIIFSLLITNFALPLFMEKKNEKTGAENETQAYMEILNNVIIALNRQITPDNEKAVKAVIKDYYERGSALRDKSRRLFTDRDERKLRIKAHKLEIENTKKLLNENKTSGFIAKHYIDVLERRIAVVSGKKKNGIAVFLRNFRHIGMFFSLGKKSGVENKREEFFNLLQSNALCVIKNLKALKDAEKDEKKKYLINGILSEYELVLSFKNFLLKGKSSGAAKTDMETVSAMAFQAERDNIQIMFETGRISRQSAKKMRDNITLLEMRLEQN